MKFLLKSLVLFIALSCIYAAAVEPLPETAEQKAETTPDVKSDDALSAVVEDCHQPKEIGRCFALFYRFAFNVETQKCEEFIYGGCMGNKNNFETLEECENKCMTAKNADENSDAAAKEAESKTDNKAEAEETPSEQQPPKESNEENSNDRKDQSKSSE